eukprot:14256-Heterococcus_DN1.PRE.1
MAIREGICQSLNTSAFVLESLQRGRRIDGRVLTAMRSLRFTFTRAEGQASAEVQLGRTRALAVVSSEVVPPYPDRPADGLLSFSVELSKMAEASIGAQRSPPIAAEIVRIIERGVRDSQALTAKADLQRQGLFNVIECTAADTEALCVVAGERVWQLRVDVHILDHGGNLIDAAALAAIAALQHFRRPVLLHGYAVDRCCSSLRLAANCANVWCALCAVTTHVVLHTAVHCRGDCAERAGHNYTPFR